MKSLDRSVEKHLTRVIEEHIDQANGDAAEVDLTQIIMRFAMQAFNNMALGQVRSHNLHARRGSLTHSLGSGRVRHPIDQ
jgi:hypothetical protein